MAGTPEQIEFAAAVVQNHPQMQTYHLPPKAMYERNLNYYTSLFVDVMLSEDILWGEAMIERGRVPTVFISVALSSFPPKLGRPYLEGAFEALSAAGSNWRFSAEYHWREAGVAISGIPTADYDDGQELADMLAEPLAAMMKYVSTTEIQIPPVTDGYVIG